MSEWRPAFRQAKLLSLLLIPLACEGFARETATNKVVGTTVIYPWERIMLPPLQFEPRDKAEDVFKDLIEQSRGSNVTFKLHTLPGSEKECQIFLCGDARSLGSAKFPGNCPLPEVVNYLSGSLGMYALRSPYGPLIVYKSDDWVPESFALTGTVLNAQTGLALANADLTIDFGKNVKSSIIVNQLGNYICVIQGKSHESYFTLDGKAFYFNRKHFFEETLRARVRVRGFEETEIEIPTHQLGKMGSFNIKLKTSGSSGATP